MRLLVLALGFALMTIPTAAAQPHTASRGPGPAGSLVLVEESHAIPLVEVVIATRTGAAADPRHGEGLANLAGEIARRGAGGKTRAQLDEALDALGANLDVLVDADSVRLTGQVLARHLDAFLALAADIVLRPTFDGDTVEKTRREVLAQLDELRNDDRALCDRYFDRRLYGADHPYGRAVEGTATSLARLTRDKLAASFRGRFVGANMVFAAAGPLSLADFQARVAAAFKGLARGPAPAVAEIPMPPPQDGWRLQLVDKPDRQQTQVMFGHATLPATHPDFLPLALGVATFGGRAMRSTLMDEVRTKRGLAYGAYMTLPLRRGPAPLQGWVNTGTDRSVTTLKLVLRLFKQFVAKPPDEARLRFFQSYVAGTYASDMDSPARRLSARVSAEIAGLPPDHVDTFPARIKAVTVAEVAAAVKKHLHPERLALTLVATSDTLVPLLRRAKVETGAIDVTPFDSY